MLPKKKQFLLIKYFILAAIFTIAFLLMIFSARQDSQTTDEAIHLFSGFSYLTQNDFRLDPEHPPLLKEIAALPLLTYQPKYELGVLWDKAGNFTYDSWFEARKLSEAFFYSLGNNPAVLLFWGRLPFIILTLILGLAGFLWAKKMYEFNAGIFAAFLILFFPNILAHGRLINTDLGLTLFLFTTVYFWGNYLKKPSYSSLIFSGLFLGLTLASKFTGLIVLPILFLLLVVRALIFENINIKLILKYALGIISIIIIATIIIWASYGFSSIYPGEYFKGLFLVFHHASVGHSSYLLGQVSNIGWWYYFPVTIFFKTPIPVFILLILTIVYYKKIRANVLFDELLLIIPVVVFLIFSMFSRADLGIRHILPIFPFLFVFIAKSINILDFSKTIWLKIIIVLSITWYLISALISYPNYLTYFNEFAGGQKNGYKILTDSNLDWGQDIYRLKNYLGTHNIHKVYLAYPWDGDVALKYYGINFEPLIPGNKNISGQVVISATYLQTDGYSWLKKYPFEQITPGLFIFHLD